MSRKVALITGANSGLGINIGCRLIEQIDPETRLTIIVTSRTLPRVKEVVEHLKSFLNEKFPPQTHPRPAIVDFDYLLIDFANMVSVLGGAYELKQKYDRLDWFFGNAVGTVTAGIDWWKACTEITLHPIDGVTNPTYKMQKIGVKSGDGMGFVFQANVFGPYYFIHLVIPLLSAANGRIVWISSLMSQPQHLSFDDLQLIKSPVPYEGSKRLIDLVHLGSYEKWRKEYGILSFVTHPGIFQSNSYMQHLNFVSIYGMLFLFYLARLLGSPWHTIDGYRAALAVVWAGVEAEADADQRLKYGSATTMSGKPYRRQEEIDPTGAADVVKYLDKLTEEWDKKLENQVVKTRVRYEKS